MRRVNERFRQISKGLVANVITNPGIDIAEFDCFAAFWVISEKISST